MARSPDGDAPAKPSYLIKMPWHLGDTVHFSPTKGEMTAHAGVEGFVLSGLLPAQPFITERTKITAFGSCFAHHISNHLNKRSFIVLSRQERRSYVVAFNNEMVHTFSIKQQFDWVLRGKEFSQTLWHDRSGEQIIYDDGVKRQTRELFDQTDVFIFTLGLSEIWHDAQTDEVFWRSVPESEYDPARHRFRLSTVEENYENLKAIYETVREFRPDAKIVLTLSPIPLNATFRPIGCVPANSVSKAILRVAIDRMMQDYGPTGNLFYFPAYEIVKEVFHNPFDDDGRHVKTPIIHYIMCCFERFFCQSDKGPSDDLLNVAFSAATSSDRDGSTHSDQTFDLSAAAENFQFVETVVNAALEIEDLDTALRAARRGAFVNRGSGELQFLLGLVYTRRQNTADACVCFTEAVRLNPERVRFRRELAIALLRLGRPAESKPHFEAACRGGETDANILHYYAACLYGTGDLAGAEEMQRHVVKLNPDSPQARQQLDIIATVRQQREAAATAAAAETAAAEAAEAAGEGGVAEAGAEAVL
jgi:tetratricopeptide (TPR) repeat protein